MSNQIPPNNQRVFIVHNPVAGTSDPDHVGAVLSERLGRKGLDFHIHQTSPNDNLFNLVSNSIAQGFNVVWAAGGDGTVSGVANGLVNTDVPLGIIPVGTGNALARELHVPLDPAAACDLLLGEIQTRSLDVLKVGSDYFILSVSVGLSALTMAETAREEKRRFGRLAYIWNGLRLLLSNSLRRFDVVIDGQPARIRASELIAANIGIVGIRPIRWGDQVVPDDGVVNLCHLRIDSLLGFLALLGALVFDRQDEVAEVDCKPAREMIEISSRRRMPVQGDGEFIGHTPVKIQVVSRALSVIVPVREA